MLRSLIRNIAACAALLAVGLPAVAGAQTAGATATDYHFSTTITPVYGSPYPVAGHLDLEIFPSGIVRGYYHNAYQKAFVPVTGGRDGDYLWFDIGPTLVDLGLGVAPGGRLHVIATMSKDNSFRGQLYPEFIDSSNPGSSVGAVSSPPMSSIGTPSGAAPSGPDQYVFAAKPVDKSAEDYPGQ